MPIQIQKSGRRKLRMLNNSQDISDLKIPPSSRLACFIHEFNFIQLLGIEL